MIRTLSPATRLILVTTAIATVIWFGFLLFAAAYGFVALVSA